MIKIFYLINILLFLVTGCAGVKIAKITHENPYKEGIRFYRPHPYLWVTKDKDKNLQGTITWLPNQNEEYVIKVRSGIGKVETKFTLEDGWKLTEFGETRDSKTPETIQALTGTLKEVSGFLRGKKLEEDIFYPGLYMLVFDDKTGLITDIRPVFQFK